MSRHALISGASVAGPALAHQLHAHGWRTTVVERAPRLRDEGQNIDIRGAGRTVARRMGIEDELLRCGTGELGIHFVDDDGAPFASFPAGEDDTGGGTAELEILRGEISRILYERTCDDTDYRFDDKITGLVDHGDHVTATLAGGDSVDADVVVLAEGTRSRTRQMVLPESTLTELALHVVHLTIPRAPDDDRWWRWHNTTGSRSTSLRPDNRGTTRAMLTFMSDLRGLEQLDRDDQVMLLRRTFADAGWQAPRVLDALDDAPLYFDAIAQARLPRWSSGRTVLLGDAAWATGPFGMGTTLGLVGAYVLAGELARHDDPSGAFAAYESLMRPYATTAQDTVSETTLRAVNPRTATALKVRRAAFRVAAAASRLGGGSLLTSPPANEIDLPDYRPGLVTV